MTTTYTNETIPEMDETTPTEGATYMKEINNAIREIKKCVKNQFSVVSIDDTDSPYAAGTGNSIICGDSSGGAITVDIPTAVGINGRVYWFIETGNSANGITADADGTETINGSPTLSVGALGAAGIISDGANWKIITKITSLSGQSWVIKTSAYTAATGDAVAADTQTIGAFTVTMPASPSTDDYVDFCDYANYWGTNNLTIGRNAENINGLAEDMICDQNGWAFRLTYIDSTRGWVIT